MAQAPLRRTSSGRVQLAKVSRASPRTIDPAMAALMAFSRGMHHHDLPPELLAGVRGPTLGYRSPVRAAWNTKGGSKPRDRHEAGDYLLDTRPLIFDRGEGENLLFRHREGVRGPRVGEGPLDEFFFCSTLHISTAVTVDYPGHMDPLLRRRPTQRGVLCPRLEVVVDCLDHAGAFAHGRGHPLRRARAHVTNREDARHRGLERLW